MIESQGSMDRKAKWIRNIGRALAAIWAASWTLSLLAFALLSGFMLAATFPHTIPPAWWLTPALLVLPSWIGAAIPWRSERVGGVALLVVGFLLLTLTAWMSLYAVEAFVLLFAPYVLVAIMLALPEPVVIVPLLLFAGFPLAPGSLLLANWWMSRTPAPSPATE
ncbi:MAG TPA: hypothetical protein ENO24_09845 [Chloroflexi bacterium]|nr:hypothetical protein [Chloroflexota bacterium]